MWIWRKINSWRKRVFHQFCWWFLKICICLSIKKNKSDAFEKFIEFLREVENQFGRKIKRFRNDRGREYKSIEFNSFVQSLRIILETTPPYSLASNGMAERKNKILINSTNVMLIKSGAPLKLWGEAILTVCHVLNRVPYKKTKLTPFELWKGSISQIWDILKFGVA